MKDPLENFAANSPPIDDVREEAARCCDETARYERHERTALRYPPDGEFCDAAFGVAAEIAMEVCEALKKTRKIFKLDLPWSTAAMLLRAGWQRGHRIELVEIKERA